MVGASCGIHVWRRDIARRSDNDGDLGGIPPRQTLEFCDGEFLGILVVESQTTEGHVPRGMGSEQDHLLRAIDDALTKARPPLPAVP